MSFDFEVSAATGASAVIESNGARGLQLLALVGVGGDDNNLLSVSVIAISAGDEASQESLRFDSIPVENTTVMTLYPGIPTAINPGGTTQSANGVIPPKFQILVSSDMGLPLVAHVYGELLP